MDAAIGFFYFKAISAISAKNAALIVSESLLWQPAGIVDAKSSKRIDPSKRKSDWLAAADFPFLEQIWRRKVAPKAQSLASSVLRLGELEVSDAVLVTLQTR